jgi:hypothetical protein
MAVEPQIIAQVEDRASTVQKAVTQAQAQLFTKFLGGDAAAAAASALNGLKPSIDAWAERGRSAAKAGKLPTTSTGAASTWAKWIAVGDSYLSGINEITHAGLDATLDLITESIAAVPAQTAKVVKQVATVATKVASEAAAATGTVTASLIRPLLIPLLAVVAVVAFVYLRPIGGG